MSKIDGLTYEQQMGWRKQFESLIREKTDISISFIHPPMYYDYNNRDYQNEREVKLWNVNQIYNSDIVIVNLDDISNSVETIYELGVIDTINSIGNKFIHVVGVGKYTHPWIVDTILLRRETNLEDAAEYVVNYLLL